WGGKVTSKRIKEYISYLQKIDVRYEKQSEIQELRQLAHSISFAIFEMDIKDLKLRAAFTTVFGDEGDEHYKSRITRSRIQTLIDRKIYSMQEIKSMLPAKPVFECDLMSVAEEIHVIADYYKEKYKESDLEYRNEWFDHLILILILEMFVDEKNRFSELVDMLRNYDSVYLHQIANFLEQKFRDFVPFEEADRWLIDMNCKPRIDLIKDDISKAQEYFSDNKERFSVLFSENEINAVKEDLGTGSSRKLVGLIEKFNALGYEGCQHELQAVYDNKFQVIMEEYYEVKRAFAKVFNINSKVKSHYEVEYVLTILNNRHTTNAEKIWTVFTEYGHLTADHDAEFRREYNNAEGQ
ncbi:MAG: hypothetical protein KAR20_28470, partial [Candidatus Heimdallarchaeota archaeon]|nr:hypothetical protein [Candidatus Heimdallarchaeota archaeon]